VNLFAGTEDGGVYVTKDNGNSWSALAFVRHRGSVNCLIASGVNLIAGTSKGLFLSADNGTRWAASKSGLPDSPVEALAVSGANLFAGTWNGVFLSTNNGASWTAVNSGLPKGPRVHCLVVSGRGLFACTEGRGVFLSKDNGTSWQEANWGLPPNAGIICLIAEGEDIFAGTRQRGILRLAEDSDQWSSSMSGIPRFSTGMPLEVLCLTANSTDLFAGTSGGFETMISPNGGIREIDYDAGVFRSTNNGKEWLAINSGLPRGIKVWDELEGNYIERLAVNEEYLFAGNRKGIVWRLPLKDLPAK
jgi:ligand-binding sensor domain-containing protein